MKNSVNVLCAALLCVLAAVPLAAQDANPSSRRFYESGCTKQANGDLYGAAEDFHEALRANLSYGDAWFHLAEVTYDLGDYPLALDYLDSAAKYAKDRTDIQNLRGMTLISLGRLTDARAVFESIIQRFPNDVEARFGLAELDLFDGRFDGARQQYLDALKREQNSRKALLSLALLAFESGNERAADSYIQQALRYHSGESEVHYLAAYLESRAGNLASAERRARAAVQIKKDYTEAYVLLASVLYEEKSWYEVSDICDYLIARDRNTTSAWYLKGLSQYRQGKNTDAIDTLNMALTIDPNDEVMRAVLELIVDETLPLENDRRALWADYHVQKAREYAKAYQGEEARYEYQRALKIDPLNSSVRAEFAETLSRIGLNEQYVTQLKFISENSGESSEQDAEAKKPSYEQTRIADTIEAYDSLMKNSLNNKWDIDPFYLDKTRWRVGVYYTDVDVQLVHSDAEEFTARMIKEIFSGIATTSVFVQNSPVSGYGEAFRTARTSGMDYFITLAVDESEREVSLGAVVYSARSGTEVNRFSVFRTGNNRYANVLRSFRRHVLDMLPVRGKIIARSINETLVDVGKTEGMVRGAVLDVVKAGSVHVSDKGPGVIFNDKDKLATITISAVGEEIAQGALVQPGFYDRVNVGDEVLIRSLPEGSEPDPLASDTAPAAAENGRRALGTKAPAQTSAEKRISAEDMGLVRTPSIINLIRGIK
ncbi:MAG: tetratricopeptide repeat protein [Treponema sp.]|nr:tetratricopeptide repeat protein [Treponema sp.]